MVIRPSNVYAVTFTTTIEITLKIRANSEEEAREIAEKIPYYEAGKRSGDIVIDGDQYGDIGNIRKLDSGGFLRAGQLTR